MHVGRGVINLPDFGCAVDDPFSGRIGVCTTKPCIWRYLHSGTEHLNQAAVEVGCFVQSERSHGSAGRRSGDSNWNDKGIVPGLQVGGRSDRQHRICRRGRHNVETHQDPGVRTKAIRSQGVHRVALDIPEGEIVVAWVTDGERRRRVILENDAFASILVKVDQEIRALCRSNHKRSRQCHRVKWQVGRDFHRVR